MTEKTAREVIAEHLVRLMEGEPVTHAARARRADDVAGEIVQELGALTQTQAQAVTAQSYEELIASFEAEGGYPSEDWIDAFEAMKQTAFDHRQAADFLVNQLPTIAKSISCLSVIVEDGLCRHSEKQAKLIEYHTGGWSGAEDLIAAMLRQLFVRSYYKRWEVGGHFSFEVPVSALAAPQPSTEPDDGPDVLGVDKGEEWPPCIP